MASSSQHHAARILSPSSADMMRRSSTGGPSKTDQGAETQPRLIQKQLHKMSPLLSLGSFLHPPGALHFKTHHSLWLGEKIQHFRLFPFFWEFIEKVNTTVISVWWVWSCIQQPESTYLYIMLYEFNSHKVPVACDKPIACFYKYQTIPVIELTLYTPYTLYIYTCYILWF